MNMVDLAQLGEFQQRFQQTTAGRDNEEGLPHQLNMAATSMFPSVGAINHYQGMNDGFNIFNNLSRSGSGLASGQASATAAPSNHNQKSSPDHEQYEFER